MKMNAAVLWDVNGDWSIEEVDLDGLVSGVVARGTLRASTQIEPADVFVIAVPTPFGEAPKSFIVNLTFLKKSSWPKMPSKNKNKGLLDPAENGSKSPY